MPATDQELQWWQDKWWLQEEYTQFYSEKLSPEIVDQAIMRVAAVFDLNWRHRTARHPVYLSLLAKGLMPLEALYSLGSDLLCVDGSLRLPTVVDDLRNPGNYESTRLELEIAAHLKRVAHSIEFRPSVPGGREADFIATHGAQATYFEIKRFRASEHQASLQWLAQSVSFSLTDIISRHPSLAERNIEVALDHGLCDLLGMGPEVDAKVIDVITGQIIRGIEERAEQGEPCSFEIPSFAVVELGPPGKPGLAVNYPAPTSLTELRRILRKPLTDAIEQLHPDRPGIIVVQTPGQLDEELTRSVVSGLLTHRGVGARHVSAVIFLPEFYSVPKIWSVFNPFSVCNPSATFPAEHLQAYKHMEDLLRAT